MAETMASFGQSDLPRGPGSVCPTIRYQDLAPEVEKEKIHPVIFKQINYILGTLTYLDDLPISSSLQDIRDYQRAGDPSLFATPVPEPRSLGKCVPSCLRHLL